MPLNNANAYSNVLLALCVWREADDQTVEAMRGVMWSIFNRAARPMWWNGGKAFDLPAVILHPEQYSSFNAGDPGSHRFPDSDNTIFKEILLMTMTPGQDPTNQATSYYSGSVAPDWAAMKEHTVDIDDMHFFKERTLAPAAPVETSQI